MPIKSVRFPDELAAAIQEDADEMDRSFSYIVVKAVEQARRDWADIKSRFGQNINPRALESVLGDHGVPPLGGESSGVSPARDSAMPAPSRAPAERALESTLGQGSGERHSTDRGSQLATGRHPTSSRASSEKEEGMTDRERFREMFERAGIPWEDIDDTIHGDDLPAGHGAMRVISGGSYEPPPYQPHPGGFPGFESWVVFTADGDLYAVWAWE